MTTISEKQVLTNINLTETQKMVLIKIKTAPTEKVAHENVSRGKKTVVARDQLADLGLIELDAGLARITDSGEQFMKDESLIDEMGEVTEEAQKYVEMQAEGFTLFSTINTLVEADEAAEFNKEAEKIADSIMHDANNIGPAINDGDEDTVSHIVAQVVDPEHYEDMYFAVMKIFGFSDEDFKR